MTAVILLLHVDLVQVLFTCFIIIIISTVYIISKPSSIYLVDYSCYNPSKSLRSPFSFFIRILERSGLSEEMCLAPGFHYIPPKTTMEDSRVEAELVIFSAIDSLFEKTNLKPIDIDMLIVNCSVFSPAPSLVAMVMNKYKLRSDVKSYNLSGIGCSAGLISIDLARDLLRIHPNSFIIVINTKIITPKYYEGNEREMLFPNCLFGLGGATILLSNKHHEQHGAKYKLVLAARTHKVAFTKRKIPKET